jgi:hypothetical protein
METKLDWIKYLRQKVPEGMCLDIKPEELLMQGFGTISFFEQGVSPVDDFKQWFEVMCPEFTHSTNPINGVITICHKISQKKNQDL